MWWLILVTSALALRDPAPPPPGTQTPDLVDEGWLRVRLNHFDASNTDTFAMRYLYNSKFARYPASDMVVVVGGAEVVPGWLRGGLAYSLAQDLRAGLFYTEHRYYGDTRPTGGTSLSELRHLTVDQALGDLAQFIQFVKSDDFEQGRYKNGKVALMGCSYGGAMATWMKLGYPHLVQAAFSDGGPLQAQEDFPEYLEVVSEALRRQGSEECVASIAEATERIIQTLNQTSGPATISNMFNTCSQIQAGAPLDVATFFWFGVTEALAQLVTFAGPGDIADACRVITDDAVHDPAQRLANWVTGQPWSQPCIETRYTEVVAAHSNTSFSAPKAPMRVWMYQRCVQFGWLHSTSGSNHPFMTMVPLDYFHQICRDFFSSSINESALRDGIARTNHFFAGRTFLPDGVVTSVGALDPWYPVGPNATHATPLAPVYVTPGASHCSVIRSSGKNETRELEDTRRAVFRDMLKILGQYTPPDSGASSLAPIVLLTIAAGFLTLPQ